MKVLIFKTRVEWLYGRKDGLGASDVPAALGISPYKSPFTLYMEKIGALPEDDLAEHIEAVEWGLRLERPILEAFGERTGRTVEPAADYSMIQHPHIPWLRSSLDGIQYKPDREDPGNLQIKTTSAYNAREWSNGKIPLSYQVQVQAELFVSGLQWGSIVVLIGGQKMLWRDGLPDNDFMTTALPHLEKFWQCVENRTPPPVDGTESTAETLKLLHPNDNGQSTPMPDDALDWYEKYEAANAEITKLVDLKKLYANKLKAAIGEATYGNLPDGRYLSHKTQTVREYTVPENTYRVLRFNKG